MFTVGADGLTRSDLLLKYNVVHVFSGRIHGNAQMESVRKRIIETVRLTSHQIVMSEQVHGIKIAYIDDRPVQQIIPSVDGVIYRPVQKRNQIVLVVRTADCVPVLLFDKKTHMIGAIHAGWRGTLKGIAGNAVEIMIHHGAHPEDIIAVLGPYIGPECYSIDEIRARNFRAVFGESKDIIVKHDGTWHLNLGTAIREQFLESGLTGTNIDDAYRCTSCQTADYFSYRRDKNSNHEEQIGLIALN